MMKNNIKIVKNELEPNIPNPPDFNVLAQNAGALRLKLIFQKVLMISGVAVAASVVLFFTFFSPKNDKKTNSNAVVSNIETKVVPPSKELIINYDTLFVNVKKGDTLFYKGLTQIIVPPNSIVDAKGNPVESTKILFREFQNQTDIMMSGIPMTYDSAGEEFLFESGGMFEIKTTNIEEKVNTNIPIEVKLATKHNQNGFNAYQLDEKTGKWSFIEPIKPEPLIQKEIEIKNDILNLESDSNVDNISNVKDNVVTNKFLPLGEDKPIFDKKPPVLASEDDHIFSVDPSQIEELKLYENIKFKPIAEDVERVKKIPIELDYLTVEKTNEDGIYLLNFMYDKKLTKIKCTPVFKYSNDYKKALADFQLEERKFKEEQLQKQKEIDNQMKEDQLRNAQMNRKNRINNLNTAKNQIDKINYGTMVVAFSVNSFGYYNSDRPISIKKSTTIEYEVERENQIISQLYQYYVNRNAVMVNYNLGNNSTTIRYNDKDECLLVAILDDGHSIALMNKQDFSDQIINNKSQNIVLEKVDKRFKNAIELNNFLKTLM